MKAANMTCFARLHRSAARAALLTTLLLLTYTTAEAAGWTRLKNLPSVNSIQLMILMTDGSVMVHTFDDAQTWVRLVPDDKGSYVNGTWTTLGKMITPRLYFASQVLQNGRLWVMGGEYTGPYLDANWGPQAEIYDPIRNTWTEAASYPPQRGCGLLPVTSTVELSAGSARVKGIYSTFRITPGWTVSGAGIPGNARVVAVNSASSVTLSVPATATGPAIAQFVGEAASCFGDDPSILVPGHRILAGNLLGPSTYLYSIRDNVFTATGTKVYPDSSDEEGWAILPNGKILTYDLFQSIFANTGYAELYNTSTGTWHSISPADGTAKGTLPVLSDPQLGYELGPILQLLDGRALVIGANQHTALYSPTSNSWAPGPDMRADLTGPGGTLHDVLYGADDAAAALLPNGHVILTADPGPNPVSLEGQTKAGSASVKLRTTAGLQATWSVVQADGTNTAIPQGAVIYSVDSPTSITLGAYDANGNLVIVKALSTQQHLGLVLGGIFSSPTQLFDYDPQNASMRPIQGPAGSLLPTEGAYVTRMLILPTGQLLFSDSSNQLYVYTSDGSAPAALRPSISSVRHPDDGLFRLSGTRLNGQSAGASYGDDAQMNENYPLVRLRNSQGKIYYCRTTNWSSVGVGGDQPETVDFTLNPAVIPGTYQLSVIGAGLASTPVPIQITGEDVEETRETQAASSPQLSTSLRSAAPATARPRPIPKSLHGMR